MKEVESGRESAPVRGERSNFTTPEEKDVYFARLNELKEMGGLSRDDMECQAQEHLEQWRADHGDNFRTLFEADMAGVDTLNSYDDETCPVDLPF